jgi:hypothetical protein
MSAFGWCGSDRPFYFWGFWNLLDYVVAARWKPITLALHRSSDDDPIGHGHAQTEAETMVSTSVPDKLSFISQDCM